MKKSIALLLSGVMLFALLAGCGNTQQKPPETQAPTEAPLCDPALLHGTWEVGGVYLTLDDGVQYLIDLSKDDTIAGMYDTEYLTFNEDGTFVHMHLFFYCGTYAASGADEFLLTTETISRYETVDGQLVEKFMEDTTKYPYRITMMDENTIRWALLDPETAEETDTDALLFKKLGTDSTYIRRNSGKQSPEREAAKSIGAPASAGKPQITSGMKNALQSAKDYLAALPFSYSGLIEQLKYEGYTTSEATYAADNCGADWFEQAELCARNYLSTKAFSRAELIEQLEYEGFTYGQAVHAANEIY